MLSSLLPPSTRLVISSDVGGREGVAFDGGTFLLDESFDKDGKACQVGLDAVP